MDERRMRRENEERDPGDAHCLNLTVPLTYHEAQRLAYLVLRAGESVGHPVGGPAVINQMIKEIAWEVAEEEWRDMLKGEGWK